MSEKKIRITPKGPYEVKGGVSMSNSFLQPDEYGVVSGFKKGKSYPESDAVYLCRCGHSTNKPYCDGTHARIKFTGFEIADISPYKSQATLLKGAKIDMLDNESLCAVARFCDRGESVWNHIRMSDDPRYEKLAIFEASMCPSGRLTIVKKNGEVLEPALEAEICFLQDPQKQCRGPIFVKAGIPIEGADGKPYEVRNRVTLCRCGESSNMPFCDASHLRCPHMKGLDE